MGLLEAKQDTPLPLFSSLSAQGRAFAAAQLWGFQHVFAPAYPACCPTAATQEGLQRDFLGAASRSAARQRAGWLVGSHFRQVGPTCTGREGDPAGKTSLGARSCRAGAVAGRLHPHCPCSTSCCCFPLLRWCLP